MVQDALWELERDGGCDADRREEGIGAPVGAGVVTLPPEMPSV